jgi:hypothetical protein
MSYARQMLDAYPHTLVDGGVLVAAIEALDDCAQACTADVDADLSERNVTQMITCIRLCLDCADVCGATARVITRRPAYDTNATRRLLKACAAICRACGDECERHAGMHEHCRVCAEACRRGEQAADELLDAMK